MHHIMIRAVLFSLAVFLVQCSETTSTTNNPVTPPSNSTALINFVAILNDTAVEAKWWVRAIYTDPLFDGTQEVSLVAGQMRTAFHVTIDFSKSAAGNTYSYPTGGIKYCATHNGSAMNWQTITVSKGETRTVVFSLTQ